MNIHERVLTKDKLQLAYSIAEVKAKSIHFAMLDGNNFKAINDNFGHLVGDKVIERLSTILAENSRTSDVVVRFGGDEFCIIYVNLTDEDVKKTITRLQEAVRRDKQLIALTEGSGVKISAGVAKKEEWMYSLEDLVHEADKLLYASKKNKPSFRMFWDSELKLIKQEDLEKRKIRNKVKRLYFDFVLEASLEENPEFHTELLKISIRDCFRMHGSKLLQNMTVTDILTLVRWDYEKKYIKFKSFVDKFVTQKTLTQTEFEVALATEFGESFDYKKIA